MNPVQSPPAAAQRSLSGTIERIIFHNPENGFTVVVIQPDASDEPATIVGSLLSPRAGDHVKAMGDWIMDPRHGRQFRADDLRCLPPTSPEGIERYLASSQIEGVGKHVASELIRRFGTKVFEVLDQQPERLREIRGIGRKRQEMILASWKHQRAGHDAMAFLQSHGLGAARAAKAVKLYGNDTIERVRQNPYCLASDIDGIGFLTADEVAGKIGVDRHSPLRAQAGIMYVLDELAADGHCACPEAQLVQSAARLLDIPDDVVRQALTHQLTRRGVVRDSAGAAAMSGGEDAHGDAWIYPAKLFDAECAVARRLHTLASGRHPLGPIKVDKALQWVEQQCRIALAPAQRDAVARATTSKVLVITGGPGVGKTTILKCILKILAAKEKKCLLAAPTGRAAKRLHEATGFEARTIHRLLEYNAKERKFARHDGNPLEGDLLVIDEVSMLDLPLAFALLRAVPDEAALLLVGDVDQLPSVGPGRVLGEIIGSGAVPTVRLTEIFRQARQSRIVQAAHAVNRGQTPDLNRRDDDSDFYFVHADSPEAVQRLVVEVATQRIPARFGLDPVRDIQVLSPMNKYVLGAKNLNLLLQAQLNPPSPSKPQTDRFGAPWRVGDKVMQTVNNYDKDVFNGDIGYIRDISMKEKVPKVVAEFDGRAIDYTVEDLDEMMIAYAVSIHKSQGSEYPAVVIPLHASHYVMLQRNLLYTAITRGKRLVVLIGSPRAVAIAAGRADAVRRYSALAERLRRSANRCRTP